MSEDKQTSKVPPVSAAELGKLRDALSVRYGARLRPGESMTVDATRSADECWARFEISTSDDSYLVEVECAALAADAITDARWEAEAAFDEVLDMLDTEILEFFDNDRFAHFHDDWRVYAADNGLQLRLRGREARPSIEALADAWLAAHPDGVPEGEEPN